VGQGTGGREHTGSGLISLWWLSSGMQRVRSLQQGAGAGMCPVIHQHESILHARCRACFQTRRQTGWQGQSMTETKHKDWMADDIFRVTGIEMKKQAHI
jgi:hypothetical protein